MSVKNCPSCKRKKNLLIEVELEAGMPKKQLICPSAECNAQQLAIQKNTCAKSTQELKQQLDYAINEVFNLKKTIGDLHRGEVRELVVLERMVEKKRKTMASGFDKEPAPAAVVFAPAPGAARAPEARAGPVRGFGQSRVPVAAAAAHVPKANFFDFGQGAVAFVQAPDASAVQCYGFGQK